MLITLISLVVLVLGIWGWFKYENDDIGEGVGLLSIISTIISGAVFITIIIILPINLVKHSNEKIEYKNKYNNLTYQLEIYEGKGDIDYESIAWKNLYDDITEYNTHITIQSEMSKNLFIGWFYNHHLRDLELIEIKK